MMDEREQRYLRYLQQRIQDSQQLAGHSNGETATAFFARADAFEEAAGKFLGMVDERDEAENGW